VRFASSASGHHGYYDGGDAPEGYIPEDQAFEYAIENEWEAVEEAVKTDLAQAWLRDGKQWLELLNIVSRHDKEQLRNAIRREVAAPPFADSDELPESQLFAVASDVARLLESSGSPYSPSCSPSDDLDWSKKLVKLTRAFREVLFLISEPVDSWMFGHHLEKPLREINLSLDERRPVLAWVRSNQKDHQFQLRTEASSTPLHSCVAGWICEFLDTHRSVLGLSVCTECGTIFVRERRDNVYCSKTCQNRVAYKRKKIFESGVLVEQKVDPAAPAAMVPGLWVSHPRLGLGRIEGVRFTNRKLRVQFKDRDFALSIPDDRTPEVVLDRLKKAGKEEPTSWEEVVDPNFMDVRVRFLQIARTLRAWEMFQPGKKTDGLPSFYRVANPTALADLL